MRKPIADARVDAITVRALPPAAPCCVSVSTEDDLRAIRHVLESVSRDLLDRWAERGPDAGFGTDAGEVVVSGTADAELLDLEPFEGVLFLDGAGNQVVVSRAAFQRLMQRLFQARPA